MRSRYTPACTVMTSPGCAALAAAEIVRKGLEARPSSWSPPVRQTWNSWAEARCEVTARMSGGSFPRKSQTSGGAWVAGLNHHGRTVAKDADRTPSSKCLILDTQCPSWFLTLCSNSRSRENSGVVPRAASRWPSPPLDRGAADTIASRSAMCWLPASLSCSASLKSARWLALPNIPLRPSTSQHHFVPRLAALVGNLPHHEAQVFRALAVTCRFVPLLGRVNGRHAEDGNIRMRCADGVVDAPGSGAIGLPKFEEVGTTSSWLTRATTWFGFPGPALGSRSSRSSWPASTCLDMWDEPPRTRTDDP